MPFGIFPSVSGLFDLFRRYGGIDVEEAIRIFNGFFTGTTGVYNPVYSEFKSKKLSAPWRNTRGNNYTKEKFEMGTTTPLNIFTNKHGSKKFRLPISCKTTPVQYDVNLPVCQDVSVKGFTTLSVIKSCLSRFKAYKLQILHKFHENNINPISIYTDMYSRDYTPIGIKTWVKSNRISKLGVSSILFGNDITRISDSTYILEDIGNISDIEMLEIIGDINAIRH